MPAARPAPVKVRKPVKVGELFGLSYSSRGEVPVMLLNMLSRCSLVQLYVVKLITLTAVTLTKGGIAPAALISFQISTRSDGSSEGPRGPYRQRNHEGPHSATDTGCTH